LIKTSLLLLLHLHVSTLAIAALSPVELCTRLSVCPVSVYVDLSRPDIGSRRPFAKKDQKGRMWIIRKTDSVCIHGAEEEEKEEEKRVFDVQKCESEDFHGHSRVQMKWK